MCWDKDVGGIRPPGFLRLAAAAERNDWGDESMSLWRWKASRVGRGGKLARKALGSLISNSWSLMSGSFSFSRSLVSWE